MTEHATTLVNSLAPMMFPVQGATGRRDGSEAARHDAYVHDAYLHSVVDLIESLAARYPVVKRLAGDESFLGAATGFVFSEPLRSPLRRDYGDTFPQFLRSLGPSASIEYLADIAELEWACGRARSAATETLSAAPIAPPRSATGTAAPRAKALRVLFHPSVSVVTSRFPIVTIWEANQADHDATMIYQWAAEAALVAAPNAAVEIRRLPTGGHAFVQALLGGGTIADAIVAAQADTPGFDVDANLSVIADARIAGTVPDFARTAPNPRVRSAWAG